MHCLITEYKFAGELILLENVLSTTEDRLTAAI